MNECKTFLDREENSFIHVEQNLSFEMTPENKYGYKNVIYHAKLLALESILSKPDVLISFNVSAIKSIIYVEIHFFFINLQATKIKNCSVRSTKGVFHW